MAIALLAALSAAPKLLAQTTEVTAPCRMPGWANEVRCGVARRPLDPARPGGAQLDIHYVVVRALARRRLPDPVFMLAGGPGQSASSSISAAPAAPHRSIATTTAAPPCPNQTDSMRNSRG